MRKKLLMILWSIFAFNLVGPPSWAQNQENINIGIIHDGLVEIERIVTTNLRSELQSLLGSGHTVQISADKILDANWSATMASDHYNQLKNDRDVDIILGFGVVSSSVIALEKTFRKPVMVLGIIDPEIYQIAPRTQPSSGIPNFSYILFNQSLERDIEAFYHIIPYQNLGIVFFDQIQKHLPFSADSFTELMSKNNASFTSIPIKTGINDVLDNLVGIDAVYLGHLGKFQGQEKVRLIQALTALGIPTFGFSETDTRQGALASITPEENLPKIFRRMALNIEAIINGTNASELPVHISFEEKLTLNMETARKLNFYPDFSIMFQADLLNEFTDDTAPLLTINDALDEAVRTNLTIKIQELTVQSDEKEVSLAYSKYLPSLTVSANGVQIDEKRAESSYGAQPERTLTGTASVQQVIFSEQALGNIAIQKHLLRASEELRNQVKLDILLDAGEAYFNILSAQALVRLRSENLGRIKKNLDIAKQREVVGYSSRSDVYRWESQLATETQNLIAAKNTLRLTKIQMNRMLFRPLNNHFSVSENFDDHKQMSALATFKNYAKNQHSIEILTEFLVKEAVKKSTEIQQIDAAIAALERSHDSIQRQRFIPTLGLLAEADYFFARGGAGSDVVGLNGQPVETEDLQWFVGINASLPLFKGGEIWHQSEQTKIEIFKLNQQKVQLIQSIETNVRSKVLDLGLSVANLDLSKQSADLAGQSYDMVQDAYSKGAVSIVELTDAQTQVLNAELAASNSVYEYHTNLLRIQRAISNFLILKSESELVEFATRFNDHVSEQPDKLK